ncbi:MAG: hypothetical protein OQK48_07870 [Sulfurimonas sp.]|nr:hypothetical protein [Sulfurimonas sp.]
MRYFKCLLYSFIFSYSSLYSYTVESVRATTENSRSDYYNGSCGYVSSDYVRGVYESYYPAEFVATASYTSVATTYTNYTLVQSLLANPDFVFVSGSAITNNTYTHCQTNGAESPTGSLYAKGNYDYKIITNWQFVGTCSPDTVYDDELGVCAYPPIMSDDDFDDDGTLNKCDKDFALSHPDLYDSYDCDGDGIPNDSDLDYDGDGVPDSTQTSSPYCGGANTSASPTFYGNIFEVSTYRAIGLSNPDDCSYYGTSGGGWDSTFSYPDLNPNCSDSVWCYAHEKDSIDECKETASSNQPIGFIYKESITDASLCSSMVDGITYSSDYFYTGNLTICPDAKYCYLQPVAPVDEDTNSEDTDTSMEVLDLNSTTSELSPLLQASNTTNKHLDDLKDKTDITNDKLDDLKELANQSLTSSKDIKNTLDDIKSNSDKSISNQLENISKLSNINNSLSDTNSRLNSLNQIGLDSNNQLKNILEAIENKDINSSGSEIDLNATNSLLSNISYKSNFISNALDGKDSSGLDIDVSDLTSNFDTGTSLFSDIQESFINVGSSYDSLFNNLNTGFNYSVSGGSGAVISTTALGKDIEVDFCSFLPTLAPVFYYFMYISLMIVSLRLFYEGFKVV